MGSKKKANMKTSMVGSLIVITALSITALPQVSKQGPFSATITGQVQDENGQPVPNAKVLARLMPHPLRTIPSAYTDPDGKFSIIVRIIGTYRLYAGKEELFYPITSHDFYDVDQIVPPEVAIGDERAFDAGIVRLNSQAARLTLRVIDAETGEPIKDGFINFRRSDNLAWTGTGLGEESAGKVTMLVPAMPIKLEILAPGSVYRTKNDL
ncbi:MAG TPA: carboxypeptidase-like regulatory domain-containing protein [Nitrososphaera sp.]|nr:carboxypeptidase-like regulatory domain-containing protein [Nitrososphaera sp.]